MGQILALLIDITEIAIKLGISTQTISKIKKKLNYDQLLSAKRVERCDKQWKTTPRLGKNNTNVS